MAGTFELDSLAAYALLKDINRQGIHIYAVMDSILSRFGPGDGVSQDARGQLRSSAHALQRGVDAWSQTTTGAPPSREYVEASRRLYTELADASMTAALQADPAAMYQALHRGANEVAWVTSLATPIASRLLQSEILFVHARHARNDTQRLTDAIAGRMVIARPHDVPDLCSLAWEAERSARQISRGLPAALFGCHALQTTARIPER